MVSSNLPLSDVYKRQDIIVPNVLKNFKGLYIMKERTITEAERFIYRHILLKSLEGLVSPFVLIGTEVIAILLCPACIIVSNVYVYSFVTFNRSAASLE